MPEKSFGEIGDGQELRAGMGKLLRLGDTVYSFGSMQFMDSVQGAGWRWTDGKPWEVIESTSAVFGGRVTDAAASEDATLRRPDLLCKRACTAPSPPGSGLRLPAGS